MKGLLALLEEYQSGNLTGNANKLHKLRDSLEDLCNDIDNELAEMRGK